MTAGAAALLLAVAMACLGCAPALPNADGAAPLHSDWPAKPIAVGPDRPGTRMCYLPPVPLPPNSPSGYRPHPRVFTGEVLTNNPLSPIDSPSLIFFPGDYLGILESSIVTTFRSQGVALAPVLSAADARQSGCQILFLIAPLTFHVVAETNVATVRILYLAYRLPELRRVFKDTIEMRQSALLPKSISSDALAFLVGNHGFNFQPQRALLAVTASRNALHLLSHLDAGEDPSR